MPAKKTDTDLDLVKALEQRRQPALWTLLERYHEKVYSLAYSYTRNHEDAKEVAQDTFMIVWQKIKTFKRNASFSSWLFRIAANAALMKLRSRKKEKYVLIDDAFKPADNDPKPSADVEDQRSLPEEKLLDLELKQEMYKALDDLSVLDQQVFILRDVEGFGNEDVSHTLDLSVPAVKARLHRARITVRKKLEQYLKQEEKNSINKKTKRKL